MKRLVSAALVLLLAIIGFVFVVRGNVQAEATPWWSAGFDVELAEQSTLLNGHKCQTKELLFTKLPRSVYERANPANWSKTTPETFCGYTNGFGFVAGQRIAEGGDVTKGLYIKNVGQTAVHFPNNVAVLTGPHRSSGVNTYQNVSIKSDLFFNAPKKDYTTNSVDFYRGIQIDTNGGVPLRYSDNQLIPIKAYAVSENGQWIVLAVSGKGLVRVNTSSLQATTFSQDQRGSGIVETNYHRLAISNDGNRVIFADSNMRINNSFQGHQAKLYDLSACSSKKPLSELGPNEVFAAEGCNSSDLLAIVRQTYPQKNVVSDPWLHPVYPMIELRVGQQGVAGSAQTVQMTTKDAKDSLRGYLAMGDSFSSGEGDLQGGTWYELGTDEQGDKDTFAGRNLCHLSRRSYPYLLAKELGYLGGGQAVPVTPDNDGLFHSVACSGARLNNVIGEFGEDQGPGGPEDFEKRDNQYRYDSEQVLGIWQNGSTTQINSINEEAFDQNRTRIFSPEIITLGIGGNDAKFGDYVKNCGLPTECRFSGVGSEGAREVALHIASLKPRFVDAYKKLRITAPEGRIYIHGYPQFVTETGACGNNVVFSDQERIFIVNGVRYMNDVIEAAAREAGVMYVDVENILSGINLCSGASQNNLAVNGITAGNDFNLGPAFLEDIYAQGWCSLRSGCFGNESFHPNQNAQRHYMQAIVGQTNNLTEVMPEPKLTPTPLPPDFFGELAADFVDLMNASTIPPPLHIPQPSTIMSFNDTETITLWVGDLLSGSQVTVTVFSEPIEIGQFTVDEDGVFTTEFELPEELPAGVHEVHVNATNEFGQPITLYEPILVASSDDDFDGDSVSNDVDSCPLIPNVFVDEDQDGIDDVCDQVMNEVQQAPETPVVDRGQPNQETVVGNEELATDSGQTLGASTNSFVEFLQSTGMVVGLVVLVGATVVYITVHTGRASKHKRYTLR